MDKHQFDESNLREMFFSSPGQFEEGFKIAENVKVDGDFNSVVFSGEGGSAFPSQLLEIFVREWAQKNNKNPLLIVTNHSYTLPLESNQSLNVCCSYSGNTEETISNLNEAIEKKLAVVGIASGGEVERICKGNNVPFIKLPVPFENFQPRIGTGYFVSAMLELLKNQGMIDDLSKDALDAAAYLEGILPQLEKKGKEIASRIGDKDPVIYASEKFARVAMVWKIKFNEHAKNPAFWNFFPELNHNEMVGFTTHGERYYTVMLKDKADSARNLKRYDVIGRLYKNVGLESEVVELEGPNTFAAVFASLYLADFTAYYVSEKNKVDPTPVAMVEEFKAKLKQ